ncbi:MAG TPA: hypothetical protein PLO50_12420 [Nitrospira sp.]|nr:hypothetical protein [Nitrospira sp.]
MSSYDDKLGACHCCGRIDVNIRHCPWGFDEFWICDECEKHGCFSIAAIFFDLSVGASQAIRNGNTGFFNPTNGLRTPVIIRNGATLFRNGEYVLVEDVYNEFKTTMKGLAALTREEGKMELILGFCEDFGFYYHKPPSMDSA